MSTTIVQPQRASLRTGNRGHLATKSRAQKGHQWEHLRLEDRIGPDIVVLFVGINPGVRSATIGHHFAGFSNRFWKLLFDARLVPERLRAEEDGRLPEFHYGITNLVPRPTPGIDTLRPTEYVEGLEALKEKVRRWKPPVVAFVGVTLFRSIFGIPSGKPVSLGLQRRERFEGARVFVLPNPSGRNANFSYEEMRKAFVRLKTLVVRLREN
jgi:TDG/mug DNA glycosylase family protein